MGFESEKRKRIIKIGFNVALILILVFFLLVKLLGGNSSSKNFNEVESMIKSQSSIENVVKNLQDMKTNKGIQFQVKESDDKKSYKIDIKIDDEIKSYTFNNPDTKKDETNNSNESDGSKTNTSDSEEKVSTDKKESTTNSSNSNSSDDADAKKVAKEKAQKDADKLAANEKTSQEKALYEQVQFSIKNNKVLDTLKEDLNDISAEAKKKDITFNYSVRDKLQGKYVIVTEIDDVTYRDNFTVPPELLKTDISKTETPKQ